MRFGSRNLCSVSLNRASTLASITLRVIHPATVHYAQLAETALLVRCYISFYNIASQMSKESIQRQRLRLIEVPIVNKRSGQGGSF